MRNFNLFILSRSVIFSLSILWIGTYNIYAQDTNLSGIGVKRASVSIDADKAKIDNKLKIAYFNGNVIATQGKSILKTSELLVYFSNNNSDNTNIGSRIKKIIATNRMSINSENGIKATSNKGIFDFISNLATLSGNVILSQQGSIIKADKVTIDLKTGLIVATPKNDKNKKQRIKAIFKN